MQLTENEIRFLFERLRMLNLVAWEIYAWYVPGDENAVLRKLLERTILDTDALLERYGIEADPNA